MALFLGFFSPYVNSSDLLCQAKEIFGKNSFSKAIEWRSLNFGLVSDSKTIITSTKTDEYQISLSASGLAQEQDIKMHLSDTGLEMQRDSFGRLMLFWSRQGKIVWFSNRFHLLLHLVNKRVSLAGFYAYNCFSYVPAPETLIEEVHSLTAGTEVFINPKLEHSVNLLDNWKRREVENYNEDFCISKLRQLLTEETEKQVADIRGETVGVFLSGGLDSSIVAALLVKLGIKIRAYTLDFGAYGLSEIPFAEAVAQSLKIPLIKVDATANKIKSYIKETVLALDVPYGDGVTVPLYLLGASASRDGVRLVFNGEGGDQLFAGWTNKPLIASRVYQLDNNISDRELLLKEYMKTFHRLYGYEKQVFSKKIMDHILQLDAYKWIVREVDNDHNDFLHKLRQANLMLKGAHNIQPRASALASVHNLSVRTLFCSKPLTEWIFSVDSELYLRGSCEKYLLKRAFEDLLPKDIVWREKRGMGVPLTSWLLGPLKNLLIKWLSPVRLASEARLNSRLAMMIATGQFSGQIQGRRIGEILWLLIIWEIWKEVVLKEQQPFYHTIHQLVWNPFLLPIKLLQKRVKEEII